MGAITKVFSVLLRFGQLASSAIVLGLLSHFFHRVRSAGAPHPNGRLIYTAVVAALSILAALITILPFAFSFWAFPVDFLLSAAWLVAFIVLEALTGLHTCRSGWFRGYWGLYWTRVRQIGLRPGGRLRRWAGCAAWRAVIAFCFIAFALYLISGILGVYRSRKNRRHDRRHYQETVETRESAPAGVGAGGPIGSSGRGNDGVTYT